MMAGQGDALLLPLQSLDGHLDEAVLGFAVREVADGDYCSLGVLFS